jgi:hypothetical protein
MVQAAAHPLHMRVIPSDVFARQMAEALSQAPTTEVDKPLSEAEVLLWEQLFNQKDHSDS